MNIKGKINIIIDENGAEVTIKKGEATWGEVIDAFANASAGAIVELSNPDKVEDMLATFCTHLVILVKERINSCSRKEEPKCLN